VRFERLPTGANIPTSVVFHDFFLDCTTALDSLRRAARFSLLALPHGSLAEWFISRRTDATLTIGVRYNIKKECTVLYYLLYRVDRDVPAVAPPHFSVTTIREKYSIKIKTASNIVVTYH